MNYSRVINEIFDQFDGPRFAVKLWDDQAYTYGSGASTAFTLVIDDEDTAKRLLAEGALGFGEAYMENRLRVEGDLEAYLKLRHQFKNIKPSLRLATATFLANRSVPRNRKDQIAYHYDLGNDFFKLILDSKTMSYSAGLYTDGKEKLADAQQNKLKLVCDWLNLPSGATVLDLGSGWGGFAHYAAQTHSWKITGCTLSQQQLAYCRKLIKANSLQKLIAIDYRDMIIDLPPGQFDAIVMLESIEHVGKQRLSPFIGELQKKLKPGGSVYIQTTGRYKPRQVDKWTLKYVFPGGYLPAKQEILDAASANGLTVKKFVDDTPSYILTMATWIEHLEQNRSTIEEMYSDSFYKLWELWMHGAKVAFEVGSMNLFRIKLCKSD